MRRVRVTIVGSGPVGLTLALLLDHHMGATAAVTIYDGRWTAAGREVEWRGPDMGNERRQQVVTVQSRQHLRSEPRTSTSSWAGCAISSNASPDGCPTFRATSSCSTTSPASTTRR